MASVGNTYIVELDGTTHQYANGTMSPIDSFSDATGDRWWISDMQEGMSRTMSLESPVKYTEIMVRKHLQESGDFDQPVSVISHWKRKRGKNTTDVFFTAVPSKISLYYENHLQSQVDNVLLFPFYSLLFGIIKKKNPKDPIAVTFQHGRFVDLLIGNAKQIFFADRCTAFDTSAEQIQALWETVRADITTAETEFSIRVPQVYLVDWIDSGSPPESFENESRQWIPLDKETVRVGEETYNISFFNAVRMLSPSLSTSPSADKFLYYSKKAAPFVNIVLLVAAIIAMGGYYWYLQQSGLMKARIAEYRKNISDIRFPQMIEESRQDYEKTLLFVKDLAFYDKIPSYRQMINELTAASFPGLELKVFKVDFSSETVHVEVFGLAKAPFDQAHKGYQSFLSLMKKIGYVVEMDHFDTTISESTVLVKLVKQIL